MDMLKVGSEAWTRAEIMARARQWSAHFVAHDLPEGVMIGAYALSPFELFSFWLGCVGSRRIPVLLNDKFAAENLQSAFAAVPLQAVASSMNGKFPVPSFGMPAGDESGDWQEPDAAWTALIVFTSGSSGQPKGVALSWDNLASSARATAAFYDVQPGESWLSPLPLFHVGGFMVLARAWFTGITALVPAADENLTTLLARETPEWISFVPTQLARLIEDASMLAVLKKTRGIVLGGAETPLWLLERTTKERLPVSYTYGMSESASQLAATRPGASVETMVLLPERETHIEHDGRLAFRGAVRFQGYWRERELSCPFDSEGWFVTQDAAHLSEDGTLKILGRADEIFQCGGENIAPAAIERVVAACVPEAACIVVPFPDPTYGFVPVLLVEADVQPDLASLRAQCQQHLPGLFHPRAFYWHKPETKKLKPERAKWRRAFAAGNIPAGVIRFA